MASPFTTARPQSYAPVPDPVRSRGGRSLPPGPSTFPGGVALKFFRDTPKFLLDLQRDHGDAASFFLSGELFIAFFSPEGVVDVTVKKQHSFIKGVGFERMAKVLGTGSLTNEEPIHIRHRRMMQPPFHHEKLADYARMMHEITRERLARWDHGATLSANEEMMRLTFQIVAQLLFSTDIAKYAQGVQHHMGVAIDRIERTMLPGLDRFDELPVPYFRAFKRSADYLTGVADDIIATRTASGSLGDDLLGLLLAARDDEDQPMTHDEVRDETLTLILSGHETTANVMTWALCYLRDRGDLWEQLAAEADEHLPLTGAYDVRSILSAPVAKSVMSESLRLAPPVWVAPRRAIEDVEVAGVAVPKGAHVLVSQYASHRNPAYFERPNEFVPERWADQFEASLPRGAYFPFGAGTRKCLGDQFALLESQIILLEMARTARPVPIAAHPPKAEPRATYRPSGGVASVIKRRGS